MTRTRRRLQWGFPRLYLAWLVIIASLIAGGIIAIARRDANNTLGVLALLGGVVLLAITAWYLLLPVRSDDHAGGVQTATESLRPYKPNRFIVIVLGSFLVALIVVTAFTLWLD